MSFRLCHDQFGCLVDAVVRAVPIDNHAIDAAADHVHNLAMNLSRVCGTIADIHVVGLTKPKHEMGVNLRRCTRVEQGMDVHFAHVAAPEVAIALADKAVGCTCVIGGLGGQGCSRYDVICVGVRARGAGQQNCNNKSFKTHLSSGAEVPRILPAEFKGRRARL